MPAPHKPRHYTGYRREETEQVEAACLTVAVTLGALMDRLCIVGGLVPSLIIDRRIGADPRLIEGRLGVRRPPALPLLRQLEERGVSVRATRPSAAKRRYVARRMLQAVMDER